MQKKLLVALLLLVLFTIIPFGVFAEDHKAGPRAIVTIHPLPLLFVGAFQGTIAFDIGNGFTTQITPTYWDICNTTAEIKSNCDLNKRSDSTFEMWISYAELGIDWYLGGKSFEDLYLKAVGIYGIGNFRLLDTSAVLNIAGGKALLGYRVNFDNFTASLYLGYGVGSITASNPDVSIPVAVGGFVNGFDIGVRL